MPLENDKTKLFVEEILHSQSLIPTLPLSDDIINLLVQLVEMSPLLCTNYMKHIFSSVIVTIYL